jgi:16S rRNA C967 or C1407 C5-methylase (RsmB/RsmF family)
MSPEDLLALARALNTPAPLDLRVNTLKAEPAAVIARLAADGIVATPTPYLAPRPAPEDQTLPGRSTRPTSTAASRYRTRVRNCWASCWQPKRGEMVVDFCAGAGGKTLILGAMMRSTGRLYAFDVSDKRLAKLKPRAARAGLSNVHPACLSGENDTRVKRLQGKVDRVLVDAPCSGLGTLRRNPDLKWRQSPQSVDELTAKQGAILAAAAKLLRPGGRLVYATCSILAEENEAIVDAFLAGHADFHRVSAKRTAGRAGHRHRLRRGHASRAADPRHRRLLRRGAGTGEMRKCVAALLCCLSFGSGARHGATAAGTVASKSCLPPGTMPKARSCARWGRRGSSIHVQAFLLTSRSIARALQDARARGVAVEVLADREMVRKGENSLIPRLAAEGIPVWLETRYASAHNKVLLIDAAGAAGIVITGSYNFTWSAQARNAENLLILRGNPELARRYLDNWRRHRDDAEKMSGEVR